MRTSHALPTILRLASAANVFAVGIMGLEEGGGGAKGKGASTFAERMEALKAGADTRPLFS